VGIFRNRQLTPRYRSTVEFHSYIYYNTRSHAELTASSCSSCFNVSLDFVSFTCGVSHFQLKYHTSSDRNGNIEDYLIYTYLE